MPFCSDYSYPIGAFGRTLTEKVALQTGVTFQRYDPRNRYNGYQTITFSGSKSQLDAARQMLDDAVNRHLDWKKRKSEMKHGNYDNGYTASTRPGTVVPKETFGTQGRYATLSIPEPQPTNNVTSEKLTKAQRQKKNRAAKGVPLDLSGTQSHSIIHQAKTNVWKDRVDKQKKQEAAARMAREKDYERYKQLTGNTVVFLEHSEIKKFLDDYDNIEKNHDDAEVNQIFNTIGMQIWEGERDLSDIETNMLIELDVMDGGILDEDRGVDTRQHPPAPANSFLAQQIEEQNLAPTPLYTINDHLPPKPDHTFRNFTGFIGKPSYTAPSEAWFAYNAAMLDQQNQAKEFARIADLVC